MCRNRLLWSAVLVSFGLGTLLGIWMESGFFPVCFGMALVFAGLMLARRP